MFHYGTFHHLTFHQAPAVGDDEAPPVVNSPIEVWVEKSRQGEIWTAKTKQNESWVSASAQSETWAADTDRVHVFDPAVFAPNPVFDTYKAGLWADKTEQPETWTVVS